MIRVNYYAPIFGFVGWECFTNYDKHIVPPVIKVNCYQMGKVIGENISANVLEF